MRIILDRYTDQKESKNLQFFRIDLDGRHYIDVEKSEFGIRIRGSDPFIIKPEVANSIIIKMVE